MRIGDSVYLDHQATTPVDARVFAVMAPYFSESFGNPHSVDHFIGWRAAQAVERSVDLVAQLIGADADEIVFTSGATEANNLALLGLGRRASGGERRRIVMSRIEHKSVLEVGRVLQEQLGYRIDYAPVDGQGRLQLSALEEMLAGDVLAVSIMAANNEIGTIQKIAKISRMVRQCGAILHCDAAQAPCSVEMREFSRLVDLLSLSAHKMYGPKGIGALFVRRDLQNQIEPIVYGGGQQRNLRSGTLPVALCVGMGAAAELLCSEDAEREREALSARRDAFVRRLMELPFTVQMNGPEGKLRHPGNASIRFEGFDAHEILHSLQPRLAASTGSACTSGIPEPSHVLKAIGLTGEEAESTIRFSLGRQTTDRDIEDAVTLIESVLARLSEVDCVKSL